ncbi:MAG: hypothetical protein E6K74_07255 [Candidatus Eisenbacteria bacterium]|uniref:Peptidase S8/S53 domain-containing protein n=1 Tax=Eiseniibacteriota bacterium TaxID=2212470 RepID=A0A538SS21_UNCEI|nr:MAG: hypothetical protein E6K74_07255 [Candidatus Eisenbacteria bacterium]
MFEPDPSADVASCARFAKRDLDKMSWLAPLVNTRAGDLLNIELRHEQLFFIQSDQIVDDVGYSKDLRNRRIHLDLGASFGYYPRGLRGTWGGDRAATHLSRYRRHNRRGRCSVPVTHRPTTRLLRAILYTLFLFLLLSVPAGTAFAGTGMTQLLVKSKVPLTPDVVAAIAEQSVKVSFVWPEIRSMAIVASPSKVSALAANPLVEFVEPDLQAGVTGDPPNAHGQPSPTMITVPLSPPILTWNQDMANTPGSTETGDGVTVAVVDAGLPQNWEEFLPANSVDVEHAAGFGAEGNGDFHANLHAIRGVGGHIGLFPHGLAVSSIIVGFPSEFGPVLGAAPGAHILPIRVLNQFNFGWFSWFTAGIMHVANLKASGAIPGPMVINFSIQARGSSQVLAAAIDYAISQGVLFVTIAGNFNPFDTVSFPGRLPQCITAGAVGWKSEGLPPAPWFFGDVPENDATQAYVAFFSGREPGSVPAGSMIDVVAPGSYVFGEWLFGPGFSEGREVAFDAVDNFIFGTSFAAPHVAGIVARMLEKNPGLTQSEAETALRSTALPMPNSPTSFVTPLGEFVLPWDERATGAGLVQGMEAVAATPHALMYGSGNRTGSNGGTPSSAAGLPWVRVVTRTGSFPVEFALGGFRGRPCTIALYDVHGRLIRRWTSTSARTVWDGSRGDGLPAASGVYFVHAQGEGLQGSAKFVVAR